MTDGAHVGSIDAVRDFRAALRTFLEEARDALDSFDMELNRTLEWLLEYQPQYWKQEVRRSQEAVVEARIELNRCRATKLPGGETPSCSEEKKMLERAQRRERLAEEMVEIVRKWSHTAEREAAEYHGRANQLGNVLETDVPKSLALLDRVLGRLETYLAANSQHSVLSDEAAASAARVLEEASNISTPAANTTDKSVEAAEPDSTTESLN